MFRSKYILNVVTNVITKLKQPGIAANYIAITVENLGPEKLSPTHAAFFLLVSGSRIVHHLHCLVVVPACVSERFVQPIPLLLRPYIEFDLSCQDAIS